MNNMNKNRFLARAKQKDNGRWCDGSYCVGIDMKPYIAYFPFVPTSGGFHFTTNGFAEIDPDTLCGCTGAPDKNDKLIYERDIVKVLKDNTVGYIAFRPQCGGFRLVRKNDDIAFDYCSALGVEVIGNTLDNRELLEV